MLSRLRTISRRATDHSPKDLGVFQFLGRIRQKVTKDDIRQNRGSAAEKLGFLGRAIHGANPRVWLKELRRRSGE